MGNWSKELIEKTRKIAGDGCMLKSNKGGSGFYFTGANGTIEIRGVTSECYMPVPTKEVIATFSDLEEMISAGWVVD